MDARKPASTVVSLVLIALLVSAGGALGAEQGTPAGQRGERGVAVRRAVINFTELARQEAERPPRPRAPRVVPFLPVPGDYPLPAGVAPPPSEAPVPGEPVAEAEQVIPLAPSPSPATSFEALGDNNTAIPPDTMGAAGPTHLMVTLNTEIRLQNRSGGELSKVTLESFWTSTGASDVFDPKLVYDPFNNRWIFAVVSTPQSADSAVLVGVSQTSDPTGNWNLFRVDADAGDTNWADFPSLGFSKDWIVVSVNMFANTNNNFAEGKIFVFDKADLYAGGAGNFTAFTDGSGSVLSPAVTFDNSLATLYLVKHWNGSSMNQGSLRISTITGTVGEEVYTAGTAFVFSGSGNTWAFQPSGGMDFAPQMGTTDKIQVNDARTQNLIFRNGSLWTTQTAILPANNSNRSAAQWWQFLPDGTLQQFGRVEDPNAEIFYAFPSIAVNAQNDVLLGYSSFSANQFASANYSFRAATDPANTLRDDALLKAGEATYFKTFSGTRNRWGDYSHTVVDPVNDMDFWTIQEYASSPPFESGHDRWGTWWGQITTGAVKKRRGQIISE